MKFIKIICTVILGTIIIVGCSKNNNEQSIQKDNTTSVLKDETSNRDIETEVMVDNTTDEHEHSSKVEKETENTTTNEINNSEQEETTKQSEVVTNKQEQTTKQNEVTTSRQEQTTTQSEETTRKQEQSTQNNNKEIQLSSYSLNIGEEVKEIEITLEHNPADYEFQVSRYDGNASAIFRFGEWQGNKATIYIIGQSSGTISYSIIACKDGVGKCYSDEISLLINRNTSCEHFQWNGATCKRPATCNECGLQVGVVDSEHNYNGIDPYTCIVCGKKKEGYISVSDIKIEKSTIYLYP